MTNTYRFGSRSGTAAVRVLSISLALASMPMLALAQQPTQNGAATPAKPASPPPRPVVIHQDTSYQRAIQQQQQVQNQLQKNAVQNQIQQNNASQVLKQTTDPALRSQLGNANASQQQLQQAKQQDVIDRYRAQPTVDDRAVRQRQQDQQQQQQQQETKPADQEGE